MMEEARSKNKKSGHQQRCHALEQRLVVIGNHVLYPVWDGHGCEWGRLGVTGDRVCLLLHLLFTRAMESIQSHELACIVSTSSERAIASDSGQVFWAIDVFAMYLIQCNLSCVLFFDPTH